MEKKEWEKFLLEFYDDHQSIGELLDCCEFESDEYYGSEVESVRSLSDYAEQIQQELDKAREEGYKKGWIDGRIDDSQCSAEHN